MQLSGKRFLIMCLVATSIVPAVGARADVRARVREATVDFKDISLTCKVLYTNHKELQKIGKDFPKSYEFKTSTVKFKAPDKIKTEGKLGLLKAAMVINGDMKAIKIPSLGISDRENIREAPHKRQTDFDMGVFSESLWRDYKVISTSTEGDVYRLVFVRSNSDKKLACWVDSKTLKMLKVEKFETDGSLKSRYLYTNHRLIDDIIWVPTRVDVYNQDGKLAGSTAYENIKVNTGLRDSEFKP